ncbi:MAG: DUF58 domain-containing protein [Pseudomonadota bacterium]
MSMRPEPLALPFASLLIVLLFGAAQYANNLGFFFGFWLAAIAGGGLIGLRTRLAAITSRVIQAESGFAGERLHLHLELTSPHAVQVQLSLDDATPHPFTLPPTLARPATLELPPRPRGTHTPGRLLLRLRDGLGLVRLEDTRPLGHRYWVYPAPHGEHPLPPPAGSDRRAGHEDFQTLRDYQPGDSPARIHWPALARGGILQTRQFGGGGAPRGARTLDESLLHALPREERLSQLCAWLLECERRGEPYELRLSNGATLSAGLGAEQRLRGLRLLAEAPA